MSNFQVFKLSNGDDVICNLVETKDNSFKITSPLKMDTVNRITKKGVSESLALTRWIQPYSDQEYYFVQKSNVVIMAEASVGLVRYYQYVLRSLDRVLVKEKFNPTEISEEEYLNALELKKALDEEKKKPVVDEDVNLNEEELIDEDLLLDILNPKKTIH
jgi:hypothetical protein|tara:strand:- start:145 stop:624 length:480 start_codon:yes stop_codon:yes gene_type:complete